jgi:hypothetical protein
LNLIHHQHSGGHDTEILCEELELPLKQIPPTLGNPVHKRDCGNLEIGIIQDIGDDDDVNRDVNPGLEGSIR